LSARGWLAGLALLAASALFAGTAQASCGAEGCPLELRGPDAAGGRFGFDLGYQFVDQNRLWDGNGVAGPADPEEHEVEVQTMTSTMAGTARGQFGPRFLMTATLPYMTREHEHLIQHHPGYFVEQHWRYSGFGDLLTVGQYTPIGTSPGQKTALDLRAGIKLPTGRTDVPEIDGEQPEPPARPGSGSVDYVMGFQLRQNLGSRPRLGQPALVPLSLSANYRVNGKGTEDYRMGNQVMATLSGSYALSPPLRALLQLNFDHHEGDDPGESEEGGHTTEGTSLYISPGLRGQITGQVAAYAYFQIRAYEYTAGPQLIAPHHLLLGFSYSFAQ